MAEKFERYQFSDLGKMDKAVMKAFSSLENDAVHYEKGLVVVFEPTGSFLFDRMVRECFAAYGGEKIPTVKKTTANSTTVSVASSR